MPRDTWSFSTSMGLNCRSLDVSNRPFRFYMNSACNKLTYTSCQQRATKFASSFFSNERYCFLGVPTGHRHNWIQTTSAQKLVKPETYPGSTQGPRVHSRIVLINDYSSSGFSLDPRALFWEISRDELLETNIDIRTPDTSLRPSTLQGVTCLAVAKSQHTFPSLLRRSHQWRQLLDLAPKVWNYHQLSLVY